MIHLKDSGGISLSIKWTRCCCLLSEPSQHCTGEGSKLRAPVNTSRLNYTIKHFRKILSFPIYYSFLKHSTVTVPRNSLVNRVKVQSDGSQLIHHFCRAVMRFSFQLNTREHMIKPFFIDWLQNFPQSFQRKIKRSIFWCGRTLCLYWCCLSHKLHFFIFSSWEIIWSLYTNDMELFFSTCFCQSDLFSLFLLLLLKMSLCSP